MPSQPRIGFVGFGEAGHAIASGLRESGIETITAYDINTDAPMLGDKIRSRAAETATLLVSSNAELAEASDIILSTVTANQALAAARQNAPVLRAGQLYADLNSVSPVLKQAIDHVITDARASFIEVAVMAPAPPYKHKVPMLVGGPGAEEFIARMRPYGMQMEFTNIKVGEAAATKMCRSVIVKGMEALLTECVLAATRYGADERVFASLAETFPGINWSELASYMVGRVVVHGERRAREMEEVAETLRSSGVDPIMAEATVRRMDWSAQLGLKRLFGGEAPASYREFADAVAQLDRATV
jgi:3-hydroxyisobutyrate dehydrogenase-like beta-hydroxyacid dehydrogenase